MSALDDLEKLNLHICHEAGYNRWKAGDLVEADYLAAYDREIAARADEVRAACAAARLPGLGRIPLALVDGVAAALERALTHPRQAP